MFKLPATFHTSALAGAAIVTLAMLGFVDGLARADAQAAVPVATTPADAARA